jgi:hypothetical protein
MRWQSAAHTQVSTPRHATQAGHTSTHASEHAMPRHAGRPVLLTRTQARHTCTIRSPRMLTTHAHHARKHTTRSRARMASVVGAPHPDTMGKTAPSQPSGPCSRCTPCARTCPAPTWSASLSPSSGLLRPRSALCGPARRVGSSMGARRQGCGERRVWRPTMQFTYEVLVRLYTSAQSVKHAPRLRARK